LKRLKISIISNCSWKNNVTYYIYICLFDIDCWFDFDFDFDCWIVEEKRKNKIDKIKELKKLPVYESQYYKDK